MRSDRSTWNSRTGRTGLTDEGGWYHGWEAAAGAGTDVAVGGRGGRGGGGPRVPAGRADPGQPVPAPQGVRRGRARPPVRQHQGPRGAAAARGTAGRGPV